MLHSFTILPVCYKIAENKEHTLNIMKNFEFRLVAFAKWELGIFELRKHGCFCRALAFAGYHKVLGFQCSFLYIGHYIRENEPNDTG